MRNTHFNITGDMVKINELMPEPEILRELGKRLARMRKQQRFSQTGLAHEAGIGVATLRRIESGQDSQLVSWLKLMKTLNRMSAIEAWLPEDIRSPRAEAGARTRRQKKSTAAHSNQTTDGSAEPRPAHKIVWGDETP